MPVDEYRLFGPPGTGKTTQLARWIQQTVERHGPDSLIVASFTRAAARELAGRHLPLDRERLGTLHHHARRALGNPEIVGREHLREWNAAHPDWALSDGWAAEELSDYADSQAYGNRGLARWNVQRAREPGVQPADAGRDRVFAQRWTAWKRERGLMDFTDLIEQALERAPAAPGEPLVGFFDEVQDFTALELALVRHWAARMQYVVLAGDDDQCIYQFKGSTPEAFLDPPVDADHKRVLEQSYRLPRAVHAYAEQWIGRLRRREPKVYQPRDAEGQVRRIYRRLDQADVLFPMIGEALETHDRVMVLVSCGYMFRVYEDNLLAALRGAGVPFHNPYCTQQRAWNPLRDDNRTVQRLLAYLRDPWTGQDLARWAKLVKAEGVFHHGAKGDAEDLDETTPLEREALGEWLTDAALAGSAERSTRWLLEHATADAQKKLAYPLAVLRRGGVAALTAPPKLILGTIHSVKGGEADCVLLFPDLSPNAYLEGDWDAQIRQWYVGMTRAREALWLGDGVWRQVALP
jgi:DNA helicase II / ATP-dependent DNA helicase PcrA